MPHKAGENEPELAPSKRPAKKRGGNRWGQIPKNKPDLCGLAVNMSYSPFVGQV